MTILSPLLQPTPKQLTRDAYVQWKFICIVQVRTCTLYLINLVINNKTTLIFTLLLNSDHIHGLWEFKNQIYKERYWDNFIYKSQKKKHQSKLKKYASELERIGIRLYKKLFSTTFSAFVIKKYLKASIRNLISNNMPEHKPKPFVINTWSHPT